MEPTPLAQKCSLSHPVAREIPPALDLSITAISILQMRKLPCREGNDVLRIIQASRITDCALASPFVSNSG